MTYWAILENEIGIWQKGRPFFVQFESLTDYMKTAIQRPYLITVMAPATEEDMDRIEAKWLESRKGNYDF